MQIQIDGAVAGIQLVQFKPLFGANAAQSWIQFVERKISMSNEELHQWSAYETAQRVNAGSISALTITQHMLARLERLNPSLNAFAFWDSAMPLEAAAQVDARLAAGEYLPMAGVCFTVKDNLWLQDAPCTFGSLLFEDFVAPTDSWCVARLRSLGAIPLGVTNPWNTDLTPGGSSGGAVAALAAGIGHIALATDAGGSTRRPAAHTGLVGMKPTLGRIPNPEGFDDPNHLLSVIGPLTRNVHDSAWVLDLLSAWEPADPLSCPSFAHSNAQAVLQDDVKSMRLAWSPTLGCGLPIDADVLSAMQAAVNALRAAGWNIEDADPVWPEGAREYPLIGLQQAGLAQRFGTQWQEDPSRIMPNLGEQIALGQGIAGSRITELLKLREHFHASFTQFFRQYDALLCPTAPVEAWPHALMGPATIGGQPAGPRGHAAFTPIFNYGGVPAISVPCGFGRQGLPVGLQIACARFEDARVLQLAWQAEKTWRLDMRSPLMRVDA